MSIHSIEQEFMEKVSAKVRLMEEGLGRYRVFTPFQFDDGDHLAIVLKQVGQQWQLSDEAHTFMHLTYDIDEQDLLSGNRQIIIDNALSMFYVEDRDGELVLNIENEQYGDALLLLHPGLAQNYRCVLPITRGCPLHFFGGFQGPVHRVNGTGGAQNFRLARPAT